MTPDGHSGMKKKPTMSWYEPFDPSKSCRPIDHYARKGPVTSCVAHASPSRCERVGRSARDVTRSESGELIMHLSYRYLFTYIASQIPHLSSLTHSRKIKNGSFSRLLRPSRAPGGPRALSRCFSRIAPSKPNWHLRSRFDLPSLFFCCL